MRNIVPDDKEFRNILDQICALDERIMKAERDDDVLIIYVNMSPCHLKADEGQILKEQGALIMGIGNCIDYAEYYLASKNHKSVNKACRKSMNSFHKRPSCMSDVA